MIKINKFLFVILLAIPSLASCNNNQNTSESKESESESVISETEEVLSYDRRVYNVENLGFVTGRDSPGQTQEFDVGGCDLGFPLYIKEIG